MAVHYDLKQTIRKGLSAINVGARFGLISNTEVSGANTFAVFRARVQTIRDNHPSVEVRNVGVKVLTGLDLANRADVLTDTNLNGKTTLDQVRALFTAADQILPSDYDQELPQ